MKSLKEMSIEELHTLIADAQNEIGLREAAGNGFYKEFSRGRKAYRPCTYKQVQFAESLASKTGSVIEPNVSQLIKYLEMDEMSEAIDLMKEGKRIKIS
jgi:hypothetical protein